MKAYQFLIGVGTDHKGRTREEYESISDEELESSHDRIQWMMPLNEPSAHSRSAPVLSEDEIRAIRDDMKARDQLFSFFRQYVDFLGLQLVVSEYGDPVRVQNRLPKWTYAPHWLSPYNHNYKRISRAMNSLRLLGGDYEAAWVDEFFDCLSGIYEEYKHVIGTTAFAFWREAAGKVQ